MLSSQDKTALRGWVARKPNIDHVTTNRLGVHVASHDELDVREFSIEERIGSLFTIRLSAVSENHAVEFDAVVGRPARFEMHDQGRFRIWTGICSHMEQMQREDEGVSTYEL